MSYPPPPLRQFQRNLPPPDVVIFVLAIIILAFACRMHPVSSLPPIPRSPGNALCAVNAPSPTESQIQHAMSVYRAAHPHCEVPGCTHAETHDNPVNVHHIIPQEACKSINPWLAADTNNMISLCRYQHIALGHCGDGACHWYCPNLREVLKIRKIEENK